MIEKLLNSLLSTKTFIRRFVQQGAYQVLNLIRILNLVLGLIRKYDLRLLNLQQHHVPGLIVERCHAYQHLIDQDAQSPPVYWFPVSLTRDHLRGDVLRSSAEGGGCLVTGNYLGKSKIYEDEVAVFVDHDVFEF